MNIPNNVICIVCRKRVSKKMLTDEAVRRKIGICSRKCSIKLRRRLGDLIPNKLGKYQVRPHKENDKKVVLAKIFNIHF